MGVDVMTDLVGYLEWENVALLLIGVVTGITSSILGIGGGLLMVPALTYWGAIPVQATATSLLAIVLGAASGTWHNWKTGQIKLKNIVVLAIPAMMSSAIGVAIANSIPPQSLLLSFAGIQIAAIFLIEFKQRLKQKQKALPLAVASSQYRQLLLTQPLGQTGIEGSVLPTRRSQSQYILPLVQGSSIGLLAGVLSGLFGVGGGIVMIPLQMLFLGERIVDAIRTSLGAICLIAITAVTQHAMSGNVLWAAGLSLSMGTLLGAQVGARLLFKFPEWLVRQLFRGLLISIAVYMVYKSGAV